MPEDSPLRDPSQIPFLDPSPTAENLAGPIDEEETDSLRELVEQIDAHVELIGTEATSNLPNDGPSVENVHPQPSISKHQPTEIASKTQPTDLTS